MNAYKCFVAKLYMIKYVKIDPINFGLQELHLIYFTRKTNLQAQEEQKVTIRKCWINQRYDIVTLNLYHKFILHVEVCFNDNIIFLKKNSFISLLQKNLFLRHVVER